MLKDQGSRSGTLEGARGATGDVPEESVRWQRLSAGRKQEVVLRLLRGEDMEFLSRELGIPASRISRWRDRFLEAGESALKQRRRDHRDEEVSRLREKLGEATLEMELLREKIGRLEEGRPLRRRRSRK